MAIACSCHGIRDHAVVAAVDAGADSVEAVVEHCGAGATCGGCHPTLERLLEELGLDSSVSAA